MSEDMREVRESLETTSASSSESITRIACLRQRYLVTFMIMFITINCYTNRAIITETIEFFAEVTRSRNSTKHKNHQCLELQPLLEKKSSLNFTKIFKIDSETSDSIQDLFYLSYTLTHFPGGIYADSRNPKHLLSLVTVACSFINILSPSIIKITKGNHHVMRAVAILLGTFQGAIFPSTLNMMAHWAPLRERASLMSLNLAGFFLGLVASKSGTKLLVKSSGDWTTPFYVFGAIGVFLALIWELWVFQDPHHDPRITPEEKEYLDVEMRGLVDHNPKRIPYFAMFTSFQVWILILVHAANRGIWHFTGMMTPVYTKDILKYGNDQINLMSTLPYIPMTVLIIALGYFSDWITRNGYVSVLTMRKVFTSLGMMGPPIYMLTGSYGGCDRLGAVIIFVIGMTQFAFAYLALYLIPMDLSPNYTGFLASLTNGFGNFGGFFFKKVSMWVAPDKTIHQYRDLFWVSVLIAMISNLVYVIFCSVKVQPWNRPLVKRK